MYPCRKHHTHLDTFLDETRPAFDADGVRTGRSTRIVNGRGMVLTYTVIKAGFTGIGKPTSVRCLLPLFALDDTGACVIGMDGCARGELGGLDGRGKSHVSDGRRVRWCAECC